MKNLIVTAWHRTLSSWYRWLKPALVPFAAVPSIPLRSMLG